MKKTLKPLLLLMVIVLGMVVFQVSMGGPATMPAWLDGGVTLDEAVARSTNEGKMILVFVTADWCGYCQDLKRGALRDARVEELARALVVPVVLDASRRESEGAMTASGLGVQGLPTLVLLTPAGTEIDRLVGNQSATTVAAFLELARNEEEGVSPAG